MRTALYRHFDSSGSLLYVGISNDTLRRLLQHKDRSNWYEKIARIDVEWLRSRDEALEKESAAIDQEAPRWNIQGRGKPAIENPLGYAIEHRFSSRYDGWYFGEERAAHMLGWFRAVFPKDRFILVRSRSDGMSDGTSLECRRLRWSEWKDWAATPPDHSAGDAWDLAREQ